MATLGRIEWWIILVISLGVFLFAAGPMWERPFEIDAHIFWSYLVIPALVALFLARSSKLRPLPFVIASTELVLIKFMITISFFAVPAWIAAGDPQKRPPSVYSAARTEQPRAEPTPIPAEITGVIEGGVIDAEGKGVSGALVWIASGLEDYIFDPPDRSVRLTNGGTGPSPEVAVLHPHQSLELLSTDEQLHVLAASDEAGHPAFTLPMLASGRERILELPHRRGLFSLRCRVHESGEGRAWVLILAHPFHTTTGEDGRFELAGVPSAQVTLRAWSEPINARSELLVRPGETHEVTLRPGVDPGSPKR